MNTEQTLNTIKSFLEFAGASLRYKYNVADAYTTVLWRDLSPSWIVFVDNGYINLVGGVTQKTRQGVGTFNINSGNPESGFAKNYRYDSRLQRMVPPYFPSTSTFRILSWLE